MLEGADVRDQLEAYGIPGADVNGRLAALTDEEVAQLANQMEQAPSGGYSEALHFVGGVLAIILLALYAMFMMSH
jgi:hypothetical protein